jgi:CRP-like cAMP-binding protein
MHTRRLGGPGRAFRNTDSHRDPRDVLAPWRRGEQSKSPVASRWVRRLARFATLTLEEQRALEEIGATAGFRRAPHENVIKSGDPADRLLVVVEGLAYRYRLLADGRRQILAYLFAGDMCDPRELLLPQVGDSMCALGPAEIAMLSLNAVQRLERQPNIALAISRYAFMQQSIAREWLINLGQRTAFERLAHLLCEICVRLESVGLTRDDSFDLPLTQAELGDTLALSAVHVNRTLMELRRLKLVTFQNRHVVIHDFAALKAAAGFEPGYLTSHEKSRPPVENMA